MDSMKHIQTISTTFLGLAGARFFQNPSYSNARRKSSSKPP
jgi:hypothetical protein